MEEKKLIAVCWFIGKVERFTRGGSGITKKELQNDCWQLLSILDHSILKSIK